VVLDVECMFYIAGAEWNDEIKVVLSLKIFPSPPQLMDAHGEVSLI